MRIGITLGDPRGIGAEITSAALSDPDVRSGAEFIVIGAAGQVDVPGVPEHAIGSWAGGTAAEAGRLAGLAIEHGVSLAMDGVIDALVTAPIEKNAFQMAGWSFPGHTEMLRELTASEAVGMMMSAEETRIGPPLRIVLATTHIPLRAVADAVTLPLLVQQASLTHHALRDWWRIPMPAIALGALNPHASDGGLFGDEEERIFAPAITALRGRGVDAHGPLPADTVFTRGLAGEFDAIIAPYHDVGMAVFKSLAFGRGVNITLGLPFPRTSPDHGTAIELAGRGLADPSSMKEAIRTAIQLAGRFDSTPAGE